MISIRCLVWATLCRYYDAEDIQHSGATRPVAKDGQTNLIVREKSLHVRLVALRCSKQLLGVLLNFILQFFKLQEEMTPDFASVGLSVGW